MYIDKDMRSKYAIMDLREGEPTLLLKALCAYVQANVGNISVYDASRIRDFDQQIKRIKHGDKNEEMDFRRGGLRSGELRKEDV